MPRQGRVVVGLVVEQVDDRDEQQQEAQPQQRGDEVRPLLKGLGPERRRAGCKRTGRRRSEACRGSLRAKSGHRLVSRMAHFELRIDACGSAEGRHGLGMGHGLSMRFGEGGCLVEVGGRRRGPGVGGQRLGRRQEIGGGLTVFRTDRIGAFRPEWVGDLFGLSLDHRRNGSRPPPPFRVARICCDTNGARHPPPSISSPSRIPRRSSRVILGLRREKARPRFARVLPTGLDRLAAIYKSRPRPAPQSALTRQERQKRDHDRAR